MSKADDARKGKSVIDETLKSVYQETLDEGIPDRFKELLDALKHQDQSKAPRQ